MTTNFFSLLSSVAVFGSGIRVRDPGSGMGKNQDPGSGINILDPQHCNFSSASFLAVTSWSPLLSLCVQLFIASSHAIFAVNSHSRLAI
jgi:hypothetical protein